jgi:hypothetical protein
MVIPMGVDYSLLESKKPVLTDREVFFESGYVYVDRENTLRMEPVIKNLPDKIDEIKADLEKVKDKLVEDGYFIYQQEYDSYAIKIEVSKSGIKFIEGFLKFVPTDEPILL